MALDQDRGAPPPNTPRNTRERDFEPVSVEARYAPPPASVSPDRDKGWIKRMAPILLARKWYVISAIACSVGTLVLRTALPLVVRDGINIIESGLRTGDAGVPALQRIVVTMTVIGVLMAVLGYVFRFQLQNTSLKIEYDMRNLLYQHFTKLSFGFFDRVQTGQLISRANSDIRSVQMFLSFAPSMSVTLLSFFAAFGVMLTINWQLAIIAVIPLPGVYFVGMVMRKHMFPVSWLVQARTADVATIVEENVTGTRVVKSFAAERQQIGLLQKAAQKLYWASMKNVEIQARFSPFMMNFPRLGLVLVLLFGGWMAIEGKAGLGDIVAFNSYVVMLQMPFQMLGFLMMMANRARASAERIFEILDEQPEITDKPGSYDLVDPLGDVDMKNVTFAYGGSEPILENFDLRMWPGETVALVGRTGCGKSTVARLIPRFYDVQATTPEARSAAGGEIQGTVNVDGVDVRNYTLRSLRSHIGLVLDEPFLFSDTIRENIAYGRPDATQDEVVDVSRAAGAHEFIEAMPEGYDTVIGERGYTLSGGQRQRIAIARTLLVNPRILVLDDATSSIDVQLEQEIHEALKTLMRGRTTLIIAHRLSTISLADKVALMDGGKIVAQGTHQQLLRTVPLYADVLAHAEEDWQAAHAPKEEPDLEAMLPPRMRAMMRLMKEREASGQSMMPGMPPGIPGVPPGGPGVGGGS